MIVFAFMSFPFCFDRLAAPARAILIRPRLNTRRPSERMVWAVGLKSGQNV
jgi:hypothetical protein